MRCPFLLTVVAIFLLPLPSVAQSERHPTNLEIEGLVQELRREIPKLRQTGIYTDRRRPEERQQRDALVKGWSKVDGTISPFLGNWVAIEENLSIFPLPKPGQVCIVDSHLEMTDFYLGQVVEGKLITDQNLTFVLDSGFLISTFVNSGQAQRYEYANPRPLDNPVTSSYYAEYHPQVIEQFKQAGCLVV